MENLKKRIIKLWEEFTQNEIAEVIWVNRTVIFNETSDISLKTIEKIMENTHYSFEELKIFMLEEYIRNRIYIKRYRFHISQSEKYLNLMTDWESCIWWD